MPYSLKFDGVNDYVSFTEAPYSDFDGTSGDAYIEINFIVDSVADSTLRLWSKTQTGSGINRILVNTDGSLVRVDSGGVNLVSWSNPFASSLTVGQEITLRVETTSASKIKRLYINGVDKGNSNTATNFFSLGGFSVIGANYNTYAAITLRYLDFTDNLNSANNRFYDARDTVSGSTLPETANSVDGTLNNFTTDDSQWVFYSTGPNTPINPSITNLLATSVRLNWEQG